jgi:tRNA nucleotidyltransferase (CCA-adding enzyme)
MATSGELDSLVPERVFKELSLSLSYDDPAIFFDVVLNCGAFQRLFPMLDTTKSGILHIADIQGTSQAVRFAIWLHQQKVENIKRLCKQLKCPKEYQQLAELSAKWYLLAKVLLSYSAESLLDFIIATDALRRQERFGKLLVVFDCLGINICPIEQLVRELKQIDVSKLDKTQIAKEG